MQENKLKQVINLREEMNETTKGYGEDEKQLHAEQLSKMEDFRHYDEKMCEIVLETDPLNNYARFRMAQLFIGEERNLEVAKRLIDSIQHNDIMFLRSECLQLLGDIEYVYKNFEKALNYYAKSEKNNPPGI